MNECGCVGGWANGWTGKWVDGWIGVSSWIATSSQPQDESHVQNYFTPAQTTSKVSKYGA